MENYIVMILLLAPGFLACSISRPLDRPSSQQKRFDILVKYAVYSLVILFISIFLCIVLGVFSWKDSLSISLKIIENQFTIKQFLEILLIIMIISIVVDFVCHFSWQNMYDV